MTARFNESTIKAYLNLHAVLQNLEDLVKLDEEMAQLIKAWDVTIGFVVRNGPSAFLEFKNGACRHGATAHASPNVKLYFTSADHLNRMFDGKATPIPLKGFLRLGFLKREFAQLTDRLTHYLRPESGKLDDERYLKLNTLLTLQTALYAAKVLATWEPTSQKIAAHIPAGVLEVEVQPQDLSFAWRSGRAAFRSPRKRRSARWRRWRSRIFGWSTRC